MSAPACPRCGQSKFVVRGVPGLQAASWSCRSCRQQIAHLDASVRVWRVFFEQGVERPIRVQRRAA
jgi:transposase-like protein